MAAVDLHIALSCRDNSLQRILLKRPIFVDRAMSKTPSSCSRYHQGRKTSFALSAFSLANGLSQAPLLCLREAVLGNSTGIFRAVTVAMLPCYALLLTKPNSSLVCSNKVETVLIATLGGVYTVMLALLPGQTLKGIMSAFASCRPIPDMQLLADLLHPPSVTLFAWIHLLLLDLYQARHVALDGLKYGIYTAHSIILCFMCGPLGLLSHLITRSVPINLFQMRLADNSQDSASA